MSDFDLKMMGNTKFIYAERNFFVIASIEIKHFKNSAILIILVVFIWYISGFLQYLLQCGLTKLR